MSEGEPLDVIEAERIIAILEDTTEKLSFLDRYAHISTNYYNGDWN
jgi:hypothetical protein